MTQRIECICGKSCKNMRGLKIHQAGMRCLIAGATTQCPEAIGEKQEGPGLETNHSAQSLLVLPTSTASTPLAQPRIKWPQSTKKVE